MAREQFDLIVFDWDGTLMDSTVHIARSIQAACRDLGLPVPGDDLRCSRPAVSMSMSMSFCPSTMATRSSSCCVALNSMRFIERLQSGSACPRTGCQPIRRGQRHAAPYCVFTSTLERERWWENCQMRGRSGKRTRCRWARANTASNNGTTRRGFWQSDLHRLHVSFRRASYARDLPDEGCGHAAAGSLLKTPDFPLGVSHLILTSPCPALSAGRARAHAVYSQPGASRGAIRPPATYAHRINSFLPTFRYRRNRP